MTIVIVNRRSMSTRDKMIDGAIQLLATKGLQATSFSEVLELTGAPRGSIYYHFPEGKDQLIAAALQKTSQRTIDSLKEHTYHSPVELTEYFIELWRKLLTYSHMKAGCSVLAVTVATDSPALRKQANRIFSDWSGVLTELYSDLGTPKSIAVPFSNELISATEGAVVLARAAEDITPFEQVATRLIEQAKLL